MRLPALLGFIAVGIVVGPTGLRIIDNPDVVQTLAEIGVILLLFSVGIEVSLRDLRELGRSVMLIAVGQLLVTMGLAFPIGMLLGWLPEQAAVFGFVVSLSSTIVVLKTLNDRAELRSLHGRILTGIMLVQDLAFIPMMAILPALGGDGEEVVREIGFGMGKAMAVLAATAILGIKALPWLLTRVANLGSREVFILMLVAITFVTASVTHAAGLSAAMGAFLAGLVLDESEFGHRALSEIIPIRDSFSSLFFVTLGMLVAPEFLRDNIGTVLIVSAVAIFVKALSTMGLARAAGYLAPTAVMTGLGMVQIGEFSFVIARTATDLGVFGQDMLSLTVVSAAITMALTPGIMAGVSRILGALSSRVAVLQSYRPDNLDPDATVPHMTGHAIVCGLGRVGELVEQALEEHSVPTTAIELDPQIVERHRAKGGVVIHGSSGSDTVLDAAHVRHARLMVITTGDPTTTYMTAQHALQLNPEIDIVARAYWRGEGERLQSLGVHQVVWPAMEAGLEMLRHSLAHYSVDLPEVDALLDGMRENLSLGARPEWEDVLPPDGQGPGVRGEGGDQGDPSPA
jgi:CPA2 family monovalent cation:H+ antiporter-2|tara:strand:+ start:2210 stop:3922 length:1713 start_codon:yes stop_codon:yes gene_type:complete